MDSSTNLAPNADVATEFAKQRYQKFLTQDKIAGGLDVVFKFPDDKILYASSFTLRAVSEVFNAMLSETWKTTDEPITITTCCYDDFMNFLKFFYICNCEISNGNVMTMIDLAEFYQVKVFKDQCDIFLSNKTFEQETILSFYDSIRRYVLTRTMKAALEFISKHALAVVTQENFFDATKDTVMDIVKCKDLEVSQEVLFERICIWAEKRYFHKTGKEPTHEALKEELKDIIPFIRFDSMSQDFLTSFVIPHAYGFAAVRPEELQNTFLHRKSDCKESYRLVFTDSDGKTAYVPNINSSYVNFFSQHSGLRYIRFNSLYGYWKMNLPNMKSCNTSQIHREDYVACRDVEKRLVVAQYKEILNGRIRSTAIIGKLIGKISIVKHLSFTVAK